MSWWNWLLVEVGCLMMGGGAGYLFARWLRRESRDNVRYVRPRCLQRGHKWQRLDKVPIQFCNRYGCHGARVAPFMLDAFPTIVAGLERSLDRNAALSLDRRP